MIQKLISVLSGRNAAWNKKFASYYDSLNHKAVANLATIEAGDLPDVIPDLPLHKNAVSFSKRIALAYHGLLTISEDVMKVMLLGKNERPLIKVDLYRLPAHKASDMIAAQLAGFMLVATVDDSYKEIRECLVLSLTHHSKKKAVIDDVVSVLSNCSTADSFVKLYSILEKHLCIEKNIENASALLVLPTWLGEQILGYKTRILDFMLNINDDELDDFLTTATAVNPPQVHER